LTNNDIFRRIRNTFDLNDSTVIEIFSLADFNVEEEQVTAWLQKEEDDETFIKINDTELALFLNGFINLKRGKRDGEQPKPENHLNNNKVFQKLRIALDLKAEDILDILKLVDVCLNKNELSALFRKPKNKHYRECKDEILQSFLLGIQYQLQPSDNDLVS
jgi:uncharacterized protein YehS (DUF1456 family)